MKAGFADQDLPTTIFPTVIGWPKYKVNPSKDSVILHLPYFDYPSIFPENVCVNIK